MALTLAGPPAPAVLASPIAPDLPGDPAAVHFTRISPWEADRIYEMSLSIPLPMDLVRHREVLITFLQTDMGSPHPATGKLELLGTDCAFDLQPDAFINNGIPQTFIRNDRCRRLTGNPTGELWLTVKMGGPGDLGLFVRNLPAELRTNGLIYVAEKSALIADPPPALIGGYVDELPDFGLKRANLLAYMWSGSVAASRVWFGVGVIAVLAFTGMSLMPLGTTGTGRGPAVRAGAAAFSLALALAFSYLLIVPPVQAADETHHVASFANVTARLALIPDAMQWAANAHVARIMGHARERFRPQDVGHPEPVTEGFYIHKTFVRSSLTARYWQVVGRVLPDMPAPMVFLAIRLLNAIIFATAVGIAAVLLTLFATVPHPLLLLFPFYFVPALPFFGMHFGESALVASMSVVFAAVMVILFVGGRNTHWLGPVLGLVTSALVIGARNSLPMMPLVATALVLRIVMTGERPVRQAVIFWGGFGIGATLHWFVITQPHMDVIVETLDSARVLLPGALQPVVGWLTQPWVPLVFAAAGCAAEIALARPIATVGTALQPVGRLVTRVVPIGLALAILVSLIGSFWWEYPVVESIQGDGRLPLRQYLEQVVGAALTSFRLTRPGLLLSSSFWVGFGWLDTLPGANFVGFLVATTAVAVIGLMWRISRRVEVSRFVALLIVGMGLVVTLAGYTYASYAALTNIHGRYLLGWYLTIIAIFWTWPAIAPSRSTTGGPPWLRTAVLMALIVFVHAYSMTFILRRYF